MVISLTDVKQCFPFLQAKISATVLTAHQGGGCYDCTHPTLPHTLNNFFFGNFCFVSQPHVSLMVQSELCLSQAKSDASDPFTSSC